MSNDQLPPNHPDNEHSDAEDELLEGEEGEEGEDEENSHAPSGIPAWFISVAVHCLLAFFFWYMVFKVKDKEVELPPMHVTQIEAPKKEEVKKEVRDVDQKVDVAIQEADTVAPVNQLNLPTEEKTQSEDNTDAEVNKGREEAVANSEMGSTGAFMAIGAAGGGAGMFGSRNGGGKKRALAKGGGSRASESAVDSALRWLKRHQSPNGMWDVEKYPVNCTEPGAKCEPGSAASSNGSDANVAMTGYALLCFLGAGYDHMTPTKYKATVAKGLEYLRSIQKADGLLGMRNYENAVATMALAEAFAMTTDPALKGPAQNGVKVILARQIKDAKANDQAYSGLGWDYTDPTTRNDSSVTGWNVMALKSAVAGGLTVGSGMEGAKKWLERTWKATNKDWASLNDPYNSMSTFPYTWVVGTDAVDVGAPGSGAKDMAPVGALCAVFLGHHAGDPMLESLCNHIMKYQFPAAYPCNTYYMYYDTLAIFQAGGARWKTWNDRMKDILVNAQRKDAGCFDGSWDWTGTQFPGFDMGRILSTCYCCLCLEVYYRYKQVGAGVNEPHPNIR